MPQGSEESGDVCCSVRDDCPAGEIAEMHDAAEVAWPNARDEQTSSRNTMRIGRACVIIDIPDKSDVLPRLYGRPPCQPGGEIASPSSPNSQMTRVR